MAQPTVKVEVAFGYSPLDDAPAWTDISTYVRAVDITRGASQTLNSTQAGQLRLTLKNSDRRFDPLYTSGAYYPNVKLRTQVRVTATYSAVTYPLFYGWVTEWPASFDHRFPRYQEIEVTATDAIGLLSMLELPGDWAYPTVYGLSPVGWWRLGDLGTADAQNGDDLLRFGNPIPADPLADGLPQCSYFDGYSAFGAAQTASGGSGPSYSFWMKTATPGVSSTQPRVIYADGPASGSGWSSVYFNSIAITDTGKIRYRGSDYIPASSTDVTFSAVVTDDVAHHIVISNDGANVSLYVDGVLRDVQASNPAYAMTGKAVVLGQGWSIVPGSAGYVGYLSDFSIYNGVLAAADVTNLYQSGLGWPDQTTDERMNSILDAVLWPDTWQSLDVSTITCGVQTADATAGDALRLVAATEGGFWFVSRDGVVTSKDRFWFVTDTTGANIQATFSDDGADVPYRGGGFAYDADAWLLNDFTVTGVNDAKFRATDATSISAVGRRSGSVTTLLQTSDDCAGLARKTVRVRKDALVRASGWELKPTGSSWSTVLGLELGYRVRFERTPQAVGSQIQQSMILSAVRHSIRPGIEWTIALDGEPLDPTEYFILGTSVLGAAGNDNLG